MALIQKVVAGLAGMAAAYAIKKLTQSMQKQLEQAEARVREEQNSRPDAKDVKTLRLDPKTGVYTTDES